MINSIKFTKSIMLQEKNNTNFILNFEKKNLLLISKNVNKKLLLRLEFKENVILKNTTAYFLNNNISVSTYHFFQKMLVDHLQGNFYGHLTYFSKLYMIGLGFKNFILNNKLYILVGDCNYIIFCIPASLKIFCKKNQIYILGNNEVEINNFMLHIKKIKKLNFYKGKGVLEFKNFKFTKLKVGKKQRFA